MSVIEVSHVSKEFRLGQMEGISRLGRRLLGRAETNSSPTTFKALDDVDFRVASGEVLGIIGHNGAGKSTLLKILANISSPTRGAVAVQGRVAPLIEVGAGLIGDMTGRENVYLNGAILGMNRKEIDRKFDDIVGFAELETFIDTPVKRYSSGMQVRLGFAIATAVDAEVLIVDEVLAVGDLAFQRKCFDRMEHLIRRDGRTVLLVSHNIRQVERICSRVILMDHGRIVTDGDPAHVCGLFYEQSDRKILENTQASSARLESSGAVELLEVGFIDAQGHPTQTVIHAEPAKVRLRLQCAQRIVKPNIGFGFHTTDFLYLATEISERIFADRVFEPGHTEIIIDIAHFPLLPGTYAIRVGVDGGEITSNLFYGESLAHFNVAHRDSGRSQAMSEGFVALDARWSLTTVNQTDSARTVQTE